jgi:hypothetical protein
MAETFTTDFTRYTRTKCVTTGSSYPLTFRNNSLLITDDRVHNGCVSTEATHYGIRATLCPTQAHQGVIYQLVQTTLQMTYANEECYVENEHYLEAWAIYPAKPVEADFLTNERYDQKMYNRGKRTTTLVTWFVPRHNTKTLKKLGLSTSLEVTNGLYGSTKIDTVVPPADAIRRIIRFEWDYMNHQCTDHMETHPVLK